MSKDFDFPTILNFSKRDPNEGEGLLGLLKEIGTPVEVVDELPSRFQLGDKVNTTGKRGRVVGVTFAYVDFQDGFGEGGKIYYTVEFSDGSRKEFMSNDVNPTINVVKLQG